jgi:hypothetical protein
MATRKTTETDDKKATSKKTTAAKATKKAAGDKTTVTTRKTPGRKKAVHPEIYVQFWGKEVYTKEVVENIKKIWTEEMGKAESEITDLKIYVKPEDNGAHYVINNEVRGFLAL